MTTWTSDELSAIGAAEELQIAPVRGDGTLRSPATIWVVRVDDDLYIRSWRGTSGRWFRNALRTHEGHIRAGTVDKDVTLAAADESLNEAIDAAYRAKYHRYADSYVPPMVSPAARATTLKLVPRSPSS